MVTLLQFCILEVCALLFIIFIIIRIIAIQWLLLVSFITCLILLVKLVRLEHSSVLFHASLSVLIGLPVGLKAASVVRLTL